MTLTIEKSVSDEEKIQFINEIVIIHKFTKINTSTTIQPDVVNIECVTSERLKSILDQIDKTNLTVTIDHDDDTIILVH
jgi:hypothetical protein